MLWDFIVLFFPLPNRCSYGEAAGSLANGYSCHPSVCVEWFWRLCSETCCLWTADKITFWNISANSEINSVESLRMALENIMAIGCKSAVYTHNNIVRYISGIWDVRWVWPIAEFIIWGVCVRLSLRHASPKFSWIHNPNLQAVRF